MLRFVTYNGLTFSTLFLKVVRIYVEITILEANPTIASEPSVQAEKGGESASSQGYNDEAIKEESPDCQMRHRLEESTKYSHSKNADEKSDKSSESDRVVRQFAADLFPAITSLALCLACGAAVHQLPDFIYSRLIPQSIEHPDTVWKTAEMSVAAAFTGTIFGLAFILPLVASATKR